MNIRTKYQNKHFASVNYASNNNKVVNMITPINEHITIAYPINEDNNNLVTLSDMFNARKHVAIASHIVKSIANMVTTTSDGKIKAHRSAQACQDIVNSGYTQAIFEDITQAIAETLINWYANDSIFGVVKIIDGLFNFDTYTNKNGDEKSYYNKLYGVVEKVLADNSNKSQSASGILQNYDVLYVSDNSENQTSATHINPRYLQFVAYDGGLNEVIKRKDFNDFIVYASTKSKLVSKTTIKSFMQVLYGCIDGLTLETIANRHNIGIATVKRRKADIKAVYSEWIKNGGKIRLKADNDMFYGCASFGNNGIYATNDGYFDGAKKCKNYPIVNDIVPLWKKADNEDNKNGDMRYSKDSYVHIVDNGRTLLVFYRTDIDGDNGEKIHNDIFIREIEKA